MTIIVDFLNERWLVFQSNQIVFVLFLMFFLMCALFNGMRCLGSSGLVLGGRLRPVCYGMLCGLRLDGWFGSGLWWSVQACLGVVWFFFMPRELAWSAILWIKFFDSTEWPTVLVRYVGGGPCSFGGCLCGLFCATLELSIRPHAV